MNEANLDHLLQVTAPRSTWGSTGVGGGREERPAFDDHLAQASPPQVRTEPIRAWEPPPAESQPPASEPATTVDSISSDGDESGSPNSDFARYENRRPDENRAPVEPGSEEATAETVPADTSAAVGSDETNQVNEPNQDESDGQENEAAELVAATEAAASVFAITTQSTQETEVIDQGVEVSGNSEAVKQSAEETATLHEQTPEDRAQPLPQDDGAADFDAAARIKSQSIPEGASAPAMTEIGSNVGHDITNGLRALRKQGDDPAPGHARADRPGAVPKRPRNLEREATTGDDVPANQNPEEAADAPGHTESAVTKMEHTTNEPREPAVARTTAGRPHSRSEFPSATNRTPLAAAVPGQPTDSANETAKPEATDETVRPVAPQGPRTDALLHPLARLHRNGTASAARGSRDAKSEDGPRVDATRFVNRVAKAFQTAQERGGVLQLRLSPPELGALRIELLVQDGVLAAKLETETPAARRVLLDHLPVLRDRLAEQSIRVERFDVDVRQEGGGHSPANPHENRQQQPQHGSPHRQLPRPTTSTSETITATPAIAPPITDTQINLVA